MQVREETSSLTCIPDGHLHRVIYTRQCIDTIDSPDDDHRVARNMYRSEINTLKECVKLVINTNLICFLIVFIAHICITTYHIILKPVRQI
jgi:hypothetical protein